MEENIMQEQKVNPFEYVTITLDEYRELVTAAAKKKAKKEFKKQLAEIESSRDTYRKWYREEQAKSEQLRKYLDDAKALIREKLGIDPDTEKLAELQFEKGVDTNVDA